MSAFLLFFFLAHTETELALKVVVSIDIGRPVTSLEAKVGSDHSIYLLDSYLGTVFHYNRSGGLLRTIGGKGQGPGELERPRFLSLLEDKLFVLGGGFVNVFSLDGNFIDKVRLPVRGSFFKVVGGWVHRTSDFYYSDGGGKITWYDELFKKSEPLAQWGETLAGSDNAEQLIRQTLNKRQRGSSRERGLFVVGPEGKIAFFRPTGRFEIQFIDLLQKTVVKTIVKDMEPIPVDDAYATAYLAKLNARLAEYGLPQKSRESLPEYFSLVSDLWVGADGILIVSAVDPQNTMNFRHWYFDQTGREVRPGLSPAGSRGVLAILGEQAYVIAYSEEKEESMIVLCPLSQVNEYVQKNPITAFPIPMNR